MKPSAELRLKRLLVDILSAELLAEVSQRDVSSLHRYLVDYTTTHGKFFPHLIFQSNDALLVRMSTADAYTSIFYNFLVDNTDHIEKDTNKSRKLEREVKSILDTFGDLLPFQLGDKHVFFIFLHVFLLVQPWVLPEDALQDALEEYGNLYRKPLTKFFTALLIVYQTKSDETLATFVESVFHKSEGFGSAICEIYLTQLGSDE